MSSEKSKLRYEKYKKGDTYKNRISSPEYKVKKRFYGIQYYQENKEHILEAIKSYELTPKGQEVRKKCADNYYNSEHGQLKRRNGYLLRTYGITLDKYNEMLVNQNNSCFICHTNILELKRGLFVDHNHKKIQ